MIDNIEKVFFHFNLNFYIFVKIKRLLHENIVRQMSDYFFILKLNFENYGKLCYKGGIRENES